MKVQKAFLINEPETVGQLRVCDNKPKSPGQHVWVLAGHSGALLTPKQVAKLRDWLSRWLERAEGGVEK